MKIRHGNLFDVLPTLEAASFDSCVTDPPYGLEFMGKEWDCLAGSFSRGGGNGQWAAQHGTTRKGFDGYGPLPNFVGGGNIKCPDCGRPVDGRDPDQENRRKGYRCACGGAKRERQRLAARAMQDWHERWAHEVFRVLRPGAHLVAFGGTRTSHRMVCAIEDAGFEIRDSLCWLYGQGFPKNRNLGAGWGTALKPGHEPIVLARKPFKVSITANHQQYGVGGLNVDGCRIDGVLASGGPSTGRRFADGDSGFTERPRTEPHDLGRWPANVLLDDEAARLLDEQSGELASGELHSRYGDTPSTTEVYGAYKQRSNVQHADTGGASRFFYVAKPSREERNLGCWDLPLGEPPASARSNPAPGRQLPLGARRENFHPTVKPLALMRWLVRLVTPSNGIVLDPFGGSGTTAMACAAEGFDFVVIEREADYIPILEARVRAIAPLFTEGLL